MALCVACGAASPDGQRFCGSCGVRLSGSAELYERRKTVTVVFCDVVGSTALGESRDPEALRSLLARYFDRMRSIVESHGGTVEKFIGDAVMAVFGVPVVHEDDALRALRAASEMRDALPMLGVEGRLGVDSGEVVTGTEERLATGDAVNVAARLQQAAAAGEILIGRQTWLLARDAATVEALEPFELKGKRDPVAAYRLLDLATHVPGTARRDDTRLVGRSHELAALHAAFAGSVRRRGCTLFTLLGAAGVGKSRLVREFLAGLDALVVEGQCLSYGEGITYWPVVEVVKKLGGADERLLAESVGAAETIELLLGEREGSTSPEEIAWAVRMLLEALARERPLVVVFDDIQWGEPAFLDLVEHVADMSREAPILLLCMARPELLDVRPGWGGGKLSASTVLLEPLDAAETDELITRLLGADRLDAALAERIRSAADGNPLFLEEMIAMTREAGADGVSVPPTIRALLAARLDRLDPTERWVLERGSVEGQLFHAAAVEALGRETVPVRRALAALVRKDLIRPDRPQLAIGEAYRFRHLLIRDAAYDTLAKATRAELHERFADWLDEHGSDLVERDEILGYHLEQAHRYRVELADEAAAGGALAGRAAAALASAGARARERGDGPAAINLLGRAAALEPDQAARLELLPPLGTALADRGEYTQAEAILAEVTAAGGAAPAGAVANSRLVRLVIDRHVDPSRWYEAVEGEARAAERVFAALGDERGLAHAARLRGLAHCDALRYTNAEEHLVEALEHAQRANDATERRLIIMLLANIYALGPTPAPDAAAALARLQELGQGDPVVEAAVLEWKSMLATVVGNIAEASSSRARAIAIYEERGFRTRALLARFRGSHWDLLASDAAGAERAARHAVEELRRLNERGMRCTALAVLGRALAHLGRYDEALRYAEESRKLGVRDDLINEFSWRLCRTEALIGLGKLDEAERTARDTVAITGSTEAMLFHAEALTSLTAALRCAGRDAEAEACFAEAVAVAQRKQAPLLEARAREALA